MVDLLWLEVAFSGESTSLYTPLPDSGIVGPSVLEIVKDLPGRPPEDQNLIISKTFSGWPLADSSSDSAFSGFGYDDSALPLRSRPGPDREGQGQRVRTLPGTDTDQATSS